MDLFCRFLEILRMQEKKFWSSVVKPMMDVSWPSTLPGSQWGIMLIAEDIWHFGDELVVKFCHLQGSLPRGYECPAQTGLGLPHVLSNFIFKQMKFWGGQMNITEKWMAKFEVQIQSFQVHYRTKVGLTQTRPCPGRVLAVWWITVTADATPKHILNKAFHGYFKRSPRWRTYFDLPNSGSAAWQWYAFGSSLMNDFDRKCSTPASLRSAPIAAESVSWHSVPGRIKEHEFQNQDFWGFLNKYLKTWNMKDMLDFCRHALNRTSTEHRHGGRWQAAPCRVGCNAWHHYGSDAYRWCDWRCLSNHWTCTMEWFAFGRFCDAIFSIHLWYQRLDFRQSTTSGTGESCFLPCPFSCVASLCAWHSCPGKPFSSYNEWTTFATGSQYNANHGYFATHRYCLSDSYCNRALCPCASDRSHWSSFIWGTTRYWCVDPLAYSTSMDFHVAYCIGRRSVKFIVTTWKLAWLWSLVIFLRCFESRIASNGL